MLFLSPLLAASLVAQSQFAPEPDALRGGVRALPSAASIDFEALEVTEYEFRPDGDRVSAPCRNQRLRLHVGPRGLDVAPLMSGEERTWSLGLGTASVGREGRLATMASGQASASGTQARLDRGGLVETFENGPDGLKHSWIVASAPAKEDAGPLLLLLNVEGSLFLRIRDGGADAEFVDGCGEVVLLYRGLVTFDAAGRTLPSRFVPRPEGAAIEVDDRGAQYPITIDPILSGPVWTVESNQSGAGLGGSVAAAGDVDGDGFGDVLVSASGWVEGGSIVGRVWLYRGGSAGLNSTPAWTLVGDQAGGALRAVCGAGDLNGDGFSDIAVGEPNDTWAAGRVRVFLGSATGLPAQATVSLQSPPGFGFGYQVTAAGDVNSDGYDDLLVTMSSFSFSFSQVLLYPGGPTGPQSNAAWSTSTNNDGARASSAGDTDGDGRDDIIVGIGELGIVQVFRGSGAFLEPTPSRVITGSTAFGHTVARAGDVDGDGYSDVLVGSSFYSHPEIDEGGAWLFRGSPTGLSSSPAWTSEINQAYARHGASLASAGDLNGDGFADVVIGAPDFESAVSEDGEGRVSVYLGSPSGLGTTPAFTHEGGQLNARFGASLAGAGDVDGDGFGDLLVGAPGASAGQASEGRAYAFRGGPANLASFPIWSEIGAQVGEEYGVSVAHAGDLNADGFTDFVVGAFHHDGTNGANCGRVFVYMGGELAISPSLVGFVDGPSAGAELGNWVAGAGDVNGDGYDDFIAGARGASNGQAGEGRVFVYHGSAAGFVAAPAASFESNQVGASLGQCVASAGDVNGDGYGDVIFGAHQWDTEYTDVGKAFVHLGSPLGLQPNPAWTYVGGAPSERIGSSVACAGDVNRDGFSDVLVGAYDAGGFGGGLAYLFLGSASGLSTSPAWFYGITQLTARLSSLASLGDVNGDGYSDVALGSPYYDGAFQDAGRVFVFLGGPAGLPVNPSWTVFGTQAGALLGTNVASAGDVNADGYDDLLATAILYDNGQTNEGAAFVYLGSASGLVSTPAWTGELDQDGALLGVSATGPGDVNGDGFSDILVGGLGFSFNQQYQGSAYLFLGNGAVRGGSPVGIRQAREVGTPIALRGSTSTVRFQLRGRAHGSLATASTPFGRGRARLEWQIAPLAGSLGAAALQRGAWQPSATVGTTLDLSVLATGTADGLNLWRARVAWDDPVFPHGPWLSLPGNGRTELDVRTAKDCNGNGIADVDELAGQDCDSDGLLDACELAGGAPDCDANGQPDACQIPTGDCNQDSILDVCQLADNDCNGNGSLDTCDLASGAATDCNANGRLDSCDIAQGTPDCDANGFPDSCQLAAGTATDCDGNGRLDVCDIALGAPDCNANGRPDSCDLAGQDCNGNGVPDSCDITSGTSADLNGDGVPDSCQIMVSAFCFGDGSATPCPCANVSAPGRGCPNSANPAGAGLGSSGLPSRSFDAFVLLGSGMTPSSSVLYFQGSAPQNGAAGSVFGDGLRCAAGSVIRIATRSNVGGASSVGPGIAVTGQIPVGGTTRYYQAWYRDVSSVFCTTSRFNLTNGLAVVWIP